MAVRARHGYRCPCGRTIAVEIRGDERPGWTTALVHPEPMDAACRLVLEVLSDQILALQREAMQRLYLRPATV